MSNSIKVVVKVRPLINRELEKKVSNQWRVQNNSLYQLGKAGEDIGQFTFDKVYDKDAKTEDVYNDIAKPIVESAISGVNGTIFAYGQTSSGKTYTMFGSANSDGIIQLAVRDLFDIIKNTPNRDFVVRVSHIEISCNEEFKKFKNEKKSKVKVCKSNNQVKVNTKEKITSTSEEVFEIMKKDETKGKNCASNNKYESSNSHTIIQIIIESREHVEGKKQSVRVNVSQLNFIDLAGSELVGQTITTSKPKERIQINESSLTLVIQQLAKDPKTCVNYCDSKLSEILQNSLGGNAKTSIICAITPAAVDETISTLQFANQAKEIKNKPEVNVVPPENTQIQKLTENLNQLQAESSNQSLSKNKLKRIGQLQHQILNGFRQRSTEPSAPDAPAFQPALHLTNNLTQEALQHKSEQLSIQEETVPSELTSQETIANSSDEIIDLDNSKTEENLKSNVEPTELEKTNTPSEVEHSERFSSQTDEINVQCPDNDLEQSDISKVEDESANNTSRKVELEVTTTDLEVSYEISQNRPQEINEDQVSQSNHQELEEQQKNSLSDNSKTEKSLSSITTFRKQEEIDNPNVQLEFKEVIPSLSASCPKFKSKELGLHEICYEKPKKILESNKNTLEKVADGHISSRNITTEKDKTLNDMKNEILNEENSKIVRNLKERIKELENKLTIEIKKYNEIFKHDLDNMIEEISNLKEKEKMLTLKVKELSTKNLEVTSHLEVEIKTHKKSGEILITKLDKQNEVVKTLEDKIKEIEDSSKTNQVLKDEEDSLKNKVNILETDLNLLQDVNKKLQSQVSELELKLENNAKCALEATNSFRAQNINEDNVLPSNTEPENDVSCTIEESNEEDTLNKQNEVAKILEDKNDEDSSNKNQVLKDEGDSLQIKVDVKKNLQSRESELELELENNARCSLEATNGPRPQNINEENILPSKTEPSNDVSYTIDESNEEDTPNKQNEFGKILEDKNNKIEDSSKINQVLKDEGDSLEIKVETDLNLLQDVNKNLQSRVSELESELENRARCSLEATNVARPQNINEDIVLPSKTEPDNDVSYTKDESNEEDKLNKQNEVGKILEDKNNKIEDSSKINQVLKDEGDSLKIKVNTLETDLNLLQDVNKNLQSRVSELESELENRAICSLEATNGLRPQNINEDIVLPSKTEPDNDVSYTMDESNEEDKPNKQNEVAKILEDKNNKIEDSSKINQVLKDEGDSLKIKVNTLETDLNLLQDVNKNLQSRVSELESELENRARCSLEATNVARPQNINEDIVLPSKTEPDNDVSYTKDESNEEDKLNKQNEVGKILEDKNNKIEDSSKINQVLKDEGDSLKIKVNTLETDLNLLQDVNKNLQSRVSELESELENRAICSLEATNGLRPQNINEDIVLPSKTEPDNDVSYTMDESNEEDKPNKQNEVAKILEDKNNKIEDSSKINQVLKDEGDSLKIKVNTLETDLNLLQDVNKNLQSRVSELESELENRARCSLEATNVARPQNINEDIVLPSKTEPDNDVSYTKDESNEEDKLSKQNEVGKILEDKNNKIEDSSKINQVLKDEGDSLKIKVNTLETDLNLLQDVNKNLQSRVSELESELENRAICSLEATNGLRPQNINEDIVLPSKTEPDNDVSYTMDESNEEDKPNKQNEVAKILEDKNNKIEDSSKINQVLKDEGDSLKIKVNTLETDLNLLQDVNKNLQSRVSELESELENRARCSLEATNVARPQNINEDIVLPSKTEPDNDVSYTKDESNEEDKLNKQNEVGKILEDKNNKIEDSSKINQVLKDEGDSLKIKVNTLETDLNLLQDVNKNLQSRVSELESELENRAICSLEATNGLRPQNINEDIVLPSKTEPDNDVSYTMDESNEEDNGVNLEQLLVSCEQKFKNLKVSIKEVDAQSEANKKNEGVYDLAQNQLDEQIHLSESDMCVNCERSLQSQVSHPLRTETVGEIRIIIQEEIIPRTVEPTSRICHTCWRTVDSAPRFVVSSPCTSKERVLPPKDSRPKKQKIIPEPQIEKQANEKKENKKRKDATLKHSDKCISVVITNNDFVDTDRDTSNPCDHRVDGGLSFKQNKEQNAANYGEIKLEQFEKETEDLKNRCGIYEMSNTALADEEIRSKMKKLKFTFATVQAEPETLTEILFRMRMKRQIIYDHNRDAERYDFVHPIPRSSNVLSIENGRVNRSSHKPQKRISPHPAREINQRKSRYN